MKYLNGKYCRGHVKMLSWTSGTPSCSNGKVPNFYEHHSFILQSFLLFLKALLNKQSSISPYEKYVLISHLFSLSCKYRYLSSIYWLHYKTEVLVFLQENYLPKINLITQGDVIGNKVKETESSLSSFCSCSFWRCFFEKQNE